MIKKNKGALPNTRKMIYILRQFGLDPVAFFQSVRNLAWYTRSYFDFIKKNKSVTIIALPTLRDKRAQSGAADGHYFWQDLICAKWIFEQKTDKHFDVGSRVDGFVAHLLTFMHVTILDVRPLKSNVSGLSVLIGNAQQELTSVVGTFESVSSLHSIEHFGLGRYGDELDPQGHIKGLLNIAKCVKPGGLLYISFPIGFASVEFNSQRVIEPLWPVEKLLDFILEEFVLIPWRGDPVFNLTPGEVDKSIWGQAGLYRFKRNS
jgi:SAM-dependent methyltransferase